MAANANIIQLGDTVVIQRQKYKKLQKIGAQNDTTQLGRELIELHCLIGQPYGATYKMKIKSTETDHKGRGKRIYTLELCIETEIPSIRDVLENSASGNDNRNIRDDGASQTLRPEDIEKFRLEGQESSRIIQNIVANSKTFNEKTAYSQEKYLKKKEKKYTEFIKILRPNVRTIAEIFHRQEGEKQMILRMDSLSQLIAYSSVSANGQFLIFENGTRGLLPAALLNAIGANTTGKLVYMHPGNIPQKQALNALNFPEEQLKRCIAVNIYSVLRRFYQGTPQNEDAAAANLKLLKEENVAAVTLEVESEEPSLKKPKLNIEDGQNSMNMTPNGAKPVKPQPKWQIENERAYELMKEGFDSLVVVGKEDPSSIVKALLPFIKPSRPIVVFHSYKEALMDLFGELKATNKVTNIHLMSNWMRSLQILPNRTHPEMNMNNNGGFMLTGYTIS